MNINNVLVIRAPGFADRQTAIILMKDSNEHWLLSPEFTSSMSSSVPGERFGSGNLGKIYKEGSNVKDNYFRVGRVDSNFISLYNMKLLAGHNFINESENQNAVIVNQEAMYILGFSKTGRCC